MTWQRLTFETSRVFPHSSLDLRCQPVQSTRKCWQRPQTNSRAQSHHTIISGWWFQPLWKILVSWDDYSQYSPIYGKIKNVPKHQPDIQSIETKLPSAMCWLTCNTYRGTLLRLAHPGLAGLYCQGFPQKWQRLSALQFPCFRSWLMVSTCFNMFQPRRYGWTNHINKIK